MQGEEKSETAQNEEPPTPAPDSVPVEAETDVDSDGSPEELTLGMILDNLSPDMTLKELAEKINSSQIPSPNRTPGKKSKKTIKKPPAKKVKSPRKRKSKTPSKVPAKKVPPRSTAPKRGAKKRVKKVNANRASKPNKKSPAKRRRAEEIDKYKSLNINFALGCSKKKT